MVKALERELGLFNIFFIEIGNRNFPFLNLLEAVKAVKGMRCVHCFVFHPSTSAYCRSILVIEVLGDAKVGWFIPHICHGRRPCKFFLAGVNFFRFNAKNWHFTV